MLIVRTLLHKIIYYWSVIVVALISDLLNSCMYHVKKITGVCCFTCQAAYCEGQQ